MSVGLLAAQLITFKACYTVDSLPYVYSGLAFNRQLTMHQLWDMPFPTVCF